MHESKIQGIQGQVTPNLGSRNLIINGRFSNFPKENSNWNPGGGYDTEADGEVLRTLVTGNYTASQSTDTPSWKGSSYKLIKSCNNNN